MHSPMKYMFVLIIYIENICSISFHLNFHRVHVKDNVPNVEIKYNDRTVKWRCPSQVRRSSHYATTAPGRKLNKPTALSIVFTGFRGEGTAFYVLV